MYNIKTLSKIPPDFGGRFVRENRNYHFNYY